MMFVTFRVSKGSDSSDSSDSNDQTTLYTKKLNLPKTYIPTYLCDSSYCRDSSDSSDQIEEEKITKKRFHQKTFFHY